MNLKSKSSVGELSQSVFFQKISDICSAVNITIGLEDLLEVSLKETMDLFEATRGSIFILDDDEQNLTLRIARGMAPQEEASMVKRMGHGIVGQVAQLKKPITAKCFHTTPNFGRSTFLIFRIV